MSCSPEISADVLGVDAVRHQLAIIWEKILAVDSIEFDHNYFDLGGDSSQAVQMFARIEDVYKVKLPLATLYDAPTIDELARILCGEALSTGWDPLVAIQPLGSRPPFFCFHGAGGGVLNYRKLSQHLGPDQPVYGLQSQGLDGGEPPLTTIEEMAALYVRHIRGAQAHGPYFLGGYCMGGTIAYEAAQQLQAAGEDVAVLALFDTMNWHKIPLTIWSRTSYTVQQFLFHAANVFRLDGAGKAKFFKEKFEELRRRVPVWRGMLMAKVGGRQEGAVSSSRILGEIWRLNDRASWNYIPKPYPGKVIDFRPIKQYRVFSKPDLKFDHLAQGGQEVITLPVYPAGMLIEPFVEQLAARLKAIMEGLD